MALTLPGKVRASWPFGSIMPAALASDTLVPDDNLALLAAATNADPNPDKNPQDISMTGGSALIPQVGAEGSAPDLPANLPQATSISTYTVKDGDTLSQIAQNFGVSTNTILWANDLTIKSTIRPGMQLTILPVSGLQHTVAKGETLASIATKYHSDPTEIATYNGLASDATLPAGSTIIIPGGELADSSSDSSSGGKSTSSKSSSSGSSSVKQGGGLSSLKAEPYLGGSGAPIPGYFGNPLPGGIITQSIHGWNAVDIGAHSGTPIYAAADGTVIVSRTGGWNGGYGNYVVISHANGTQTLYAHMSKVAASYGETVTKGEIIGYVGMTGEATGPHLHFEVRQAANPFRDCPVGSSCQPE